MQGLKVGYGYDIHRLESGRRLILGGVEIPSDRGLAGHSDADVICHALADAILGTMNAGDIGRHFPPGDPKWKNTNSLHILRQVWAMAVERGGVLLNADITVVAEAPRLADYIAEMCANLADQIAARPDQVSIKATTNEGLGPEGRREGISAAAVCLIKYGDD